MAIYVLTNTETILEVDVRPQESHVGDSVAKGLLSLRLKQQLTSNSFDEQQGYLSTAATAAYISFNKLDQRHKYRASVNLHPINSSSFNFAQGSSSSGLGYALCLFDAWWRLVLNKSSQFNAPVFVTGEILTSGQIKSISHLADKINSVCNYIETRKDDVGKFYLVYPEGNDSEIKKEQRERLAKLGCMPVPAKRLQSVLGELLGNAYDGDPLGRWQPFKGLSSFNYEDSVRFFGREKDTERLYEDLIKNDGLLIVSGASGTGKSSLIKAGLIPRLEQEIEGFYWASTTPNSDLMRQGVIKFIVDQFNIVWRLDEKGLSSKLLVSTLAHSIDDGLALILPYISDENNCCLLYFDQYEEVFNRDVQGGTEIVHDLELIDSLARKIKPLNIILALRNEYLGSLLDSNAIQSPIVSNVASQLSSDNWYQIVHEQASFSGLDFEQNQNGDVLDKIIIDEALNTPFALPMVEFLLEQLYLMAVRDDPSATILRFKDYKQLGGLAGAIAGRASELINTSKYRDSLEQLFEAFVGLNGESLPYAKLVEFKKYNRDNPDLYVLIQEFVNANLIVSVTDNTKSHVVKLAHDRLFLNWIELKEWVQRSNSYLLWRYSIDGQFSQWDQSALPNSNTYLLRDKALLKRGRIFKSDGFIKDVRLNQYIDSSEKKRFQSIAGTLIFALMVPFIFLSTYYVIEVRVEKKYYSEIGERWGSPFGINELTNEQVSHRTYSYLLESQGGLVKRLAHINSAGSLVPEHYGVNFEYEPSDDKYFKGISLWEYKYTENGKLLSVIEKNHINKIIREKIYSFDGSNALVRFSRNLETLSFNKIRTHWEHLPYAVNFSSNMKSTNSDITQHYIEYTEDGLKAKVLYQNPYNRGVPMDANHFGVNYEYEPSGQLFSKTLLKKDGSHDQFGRTEYYYDDFGFLNVEKRMTRSGTHIFHKYHRDVWGNVVESVLLGSDNRPLEMTFKSSIISRDVDKTGNVIKISYFDFNRNLKAMQHGVAVQGIKYDTKGRIIEENFYDERLKKTSKNNSYVRVVLTYDAAGNVESQTYYNADDQLVLAKSGCAKIESHYDDNQNIFKQNCFGVDGNLSNNIRGVAEYILHSDELGVSNKLLMFDQTGSPAINFNGISSVSYQEDENGNITEEAYFDINNEPVPLIDDLKKPLLTNNVFKTLYKFNDNGNLSETTFQGKGGDFSTYNGVAKYKYKYDKLGQRVEVSHHDVNDNPVVDKAYGYFKEITVYVDGSNIMESQEFYDQNGQRLNLLTRNYPEGQPPTELPIKIISVQVGADVYIDEDLIGVTPYVGFVEPGFHQLKISKNGYSSLFKVIDVDGSKDFVKNYQLKSKETIDELKVLAANGDPVAYKNIGNRYLDGDGVTQDYLLAMDWYKRSLFNDYPNGIHNIGYLYDWGLGVEKDKHLARAWYQKSADLGLPQS